ncbi:MAG: DUF2520 domain-containing protein, partial [Candidatus Stahlbacteria bacterium]|nr:DUF2520 domain-containing protein [Candidatus Stahlbacteria bacterium]
GPAPTHNVKGPAPTHNVKGPSPTYNVGGLPPQPPLERDKRDSEESGTAPTNDVVLVHTSGTLGASILGASQSLSMHPICSFAGGKLPRGTYFGIEGAVEIGERLVKSIGGIPIIISADVKPLYHAALNFGASYFLTLLDTGAKLLTSAGIKESEEVILSLAVSTLRNVKGFGISESLTGAIERGDVEVVQKEMQAMEKTSAEWLEFYKILVRETRRMKEERGKMEEGRGEMKEGRGEMKEDRVQGSKGKI